MAKIKRNVGLLEIDETRLDDPFYLRFPIGTRILEFLPDGDLPAFRYLTISVGRDSVCETKRLEIVVFNGDEKKSLEPDFAYPGSWRKAPKHYFYRWR